MNIHEGKGKLTSMSKLVYSFLQKMICQKPCSALNLKIKMGKSTNSMSKRLVVYK